MPRIGLTRLLALTLVANQTQPLQPRQQLRHLTLITNPSTLTNQTITPTSTLSNDFQHPRSPIRQTHRDPTQRIQHNTHTTNRHRRSGQRLKLWDCTHPFLTRRCRTQIGEHDHAHQLPQQTTQRLTLTIQQTRIHNRYRRANQTLTSQRRTIRHPTPTLNTTTLIHDPRQQCQHLPTTLQHLRSPTQHLHHTHPRQRRLTIQKTQDRPQTTTHTLTPRQPTQTRSHNPRSDELHDIVEDRQQTIIAISEQVIERAPRHPRTSSDTRNRRTPITQLIHHRHSSTKQPRTLHLRHPHTRRRRRRNNLTPAHTHPRSTTTATTHAANPRRTTPSGHRQPPATALPRKGHPNDSASGENQLLDEGRCWGKRERERERCVSAADASTYGTQRARGDSRHVCPQLTHVKTTPLHAIR